MNTAYYNYYYYYSRFHLDKILNTPFIKFLPSLTFNLYPANVENRVSS
jgi:hypothetical protein